MARSLDEALESQKLVAEKAKKPGFMTSEFWLAAVSTLTGILIKAGVLASETSGAAQVLSTVLIIAGPVVYIIVRSGLKKGGMQALVHLMEVLAKQKDKDKES